MSQKTIGQRVVVRQFVTAARASRKLSANAKHVLHELLERDGQGGAPSGQAWTTQPELAAACGLSVVTAGRIVDELSQAGLFAAIDRVYPRRPLPNGEISEHGCSLFTFAYDAIAALGPQIPTHVLAPASSRGIEDLRAEVRAEFESRFAVLEAAMETKNVDRGQGQQRPPPRGAPPRAPRAPRRAGGGSGGGLAIVCEGVYVSESANDGGIEGERETRIRCNGITDGISNDPISESRKDWDFAEAA